MWWVCFKFLKGSFLKWKFTSRHKNQLYLLSWLIHHNHRDQSTPTCKVTFPYHFASVNRIKWMATLFCNLKGSFGFVYSPMTNNKCHQWIIRYWKTLIMNEETKSFQQVAKGVVLSIMEMTLLQEQKKNKG